MAIEFEVKARVPSGDAARVRAALGDPVRVERQTDAYFGHPVRDFGATDEALRVRVTEDAQDVTYKGPKLDARTKSRREVKVRVDDAHGMGEILDALGFKRVATVRKTRTVYAFHGFEAAFDEVDGLADAFLELELELADGTDLDAARADAERALARLGVTGTERRSYLEMLLEEGAASR